MVAVRAPSAWQGVQVHLLALQSASGSTAGACALLSRPAIWLASIAACPAASPLTEVLMGAAACSTTECELSEWAAN